MNIIVTILLLVSDAVGAALALRITYLLRVESNIFATPLPVELNGPLLLLMAFWWIVFLFQGLYRLPVVISRLDETFNIFKAIFIGVIIIFLATFDASNPMTLSRLFLVWYGGLTFLMVASGRLIIRLWQRRVRNRHKGLWTGIIVGYNDEGRSLNNQLTNWPVWGFNVLGFVDDENSEEEHLGKRILGTVSDLPNLIEVTGVQWILVAPQASSPDALLRVLDTCSKYKVRFMLVASYYQMVTGLVRTLEIHGLPMVEVMPEIVNQSTLILKRVFDIVVSVLALIGFFIFLPLIALIMRLDSKGPIFYSQIRVGKHGKHFRILKLRSMVTDAEAKTGPVWATENDPRVTKVGKFLRKSHLDEFPQFINVLIGQMSIVGPRPERPHFVDQFVHKIPLYERRLRLRPGITCWAQIRHGYDDTIEDVKERTKYDLFYIDHISIGLDVKIIIGTVMKMLRGGGR